MYDTYNAKKSRYRSSSVLDYEVIDPATGEKTTYHYLEARFPRRGKYKDSVLHIVSDTDELDLLAFRYYGREDLWWIIADHNLIDDPNDLQRGDVLEIPPIRITAQYS